MLRKRNLIILIISILVILSLAVFVSAKKFYSPAKMKNTNYPNVVARIGNKIIYGDDLTNQVQLEKSRWERINMPQSNAFYEQAALRQLVINDLLEQEAEKKGIDVSVQYARNYLNRQIQQIESMGDNSSAKIQFNDDMRISGFTNVDDYVNSDKVIHATVNLLKRLRLKNVVLKTVPTPKKQEAWNDYIQQLINNSDISSFVNIDFKKFEYPK